MFKQAKVLNQNSNGNKFVAAFVVVVVLVALAINSIFIVNTGEVALIENLGKISDVKHAGLNFKIPFIQKYRKIIIREQTESLNAEVSTKDIQTVQVQLSVQFRVDDPIVLYSSIGASYVEVLVLPRVKEFIQSIVAKYTIEEFVNKRSEISKQVNESLADDLKVYGIKVSKISIVNHDFSDDYEKAVEAKKVAEQAVEKAKAEQAKIAIEAENKVKLAEYELQEKELRAKANAVEASSLTHSLLQKMMIEKWNGILPKVVSDGQFILSPEILEQ